MKLELAWLSHTKCFPFHFGANLCQQAFYTEYKSDDALLLLAFFSGAPWTLFLAWYEKPLVVSTSLDF